MTYTFPIAPVFPATTLRRELDRLFEQAVTVKPTATAWQPPVTTREDATAFTIEMDLPGVSPEQVEVLAEEGVLTVRGTRAAREAREGERTHSAEQPRGAFSRRFRLPKTVDLESISAQYEHGVLTIRVAKIEPVQPRRVPVAVATQ